MPDDQADRPTIPVDDASHVVFPVVTRAYDRSRATADRLEAATAALGREGRDLKREAAGKRPVEGVGVDAGR